MNHGENRWNAGKGTTRRFVVLLFVLLSSCLTMLDRAALAVRSESTFRGCVRTADGDPDAPVWRVNLSIWFDDAFEDCRVQTATEALRLALLGTAAVVLVALLVYWLIPVWRIRRGRLLPAADFDEVAAPARKPRPEPDPLLPDPYLPGPLLPPAEATWFDLRTQMRRVAQGMAQELTVPVGPKPREPLSRHLAELADRAEVSREPRFVIDMGRGKASTAVAFGRAGRYVVALPAALLKERRLHPGNFEAVVLHELAHIRNRDVDITYLTVALWRAYCVLVLLPYAVLQSWLVFQETVLGRDRLFWADATPWLGEVLFAAFLVAQVQLSRADVLRSRELCADLDAVASGADTAVWRRHAELQDVWGRNRLPEWASSAVGWFMGLWRTHPGWGHRYRTISRSTPSGPGGNWLQVVLFFSSLLVLLRVPLAESRSWAEEVLNTAIYVAVPLLVATWFAVRPPKDGRGKNEPKGPGNPPRDRLTPYAYAYSYTASGRPVRGPEPTPRGERRSLRPKILVGMAIGALLVLDPLSVNLAGTSDRSSTDLLKAMEELPPAYRPEPAPTVDEKTRAQAADWAENGGREALTGLMRALNSRSSGLKLMGDKGPDRYVPAVPEGYCPALRKALAAADEQPRYPEPEGRRSWQSALKHSRSGAAVLCAPGLAGAPLERVFAMELDLLTAKIALGAFRLKVGYYGGGLPTSVPSPSEW
ncbi:M56 family metallopeptidase [Streptomyces sp. HD]|uniref:M56 family metallopeptidase n=1 Tax=Streptomyces sp. HD TaxID=3020892 RepID=UPI00232F877C|nr:M56 family metallopeptidase [Streptomyces sp. HD]MDC0773396.1 M56 family metallopeptidase [Streptomyces sp. HD]